LGLSPSHPEKAQKDAASIPYAIGIENWFYPDLNGFCNDLKKNQNLHKKTVALISKIPIKSIRILLLNFKH
jgi:hypothetical protein